MGFWKAMFGGSELSPEEEKEEKTARNFDLLKYDGVKALKIGQTDYAVRCFQEALKLQEDLEVHDYLSQALLRQGELADAMEELQVLAAAEPENDSIQLRIAQLAYMEEDYVRMAEACERAMQIDGNSAATHYLYAQAYKGQGNVVGAIAMLTKAIALDEDNPDAYLLRGQIQLEIGETAGADADADWLLKNEYAHEEALLLKARVEVAKGHADDAIKLYDMVTEVNPFCIEAFRERGSLRLAQGDKAGAEADMQKVLELDPNLLADVSGDYSAEGIEQRVSQAYSAVNPLGL